MRKVQKPIIEWKIVKDEESEKRLKQAYGRIFSIALKNIKEKNARKPT